MDNKSSKIIRLVALVLGLIGAVMLIQVLSADSVALETDPEAQGIVSAFVGYAVYLLYLTAILAIGFSLFNLVKNPAALKKVGISVGALVLVYIISLVMADDTAIIGSDGSIISEAGDVPKRVGTMLRTTYILGIVGLGLVLFGSFKGMLSNK